MENNKNLTLEKEVLFGDFRKSKSLTKKEFINVMITNVIFLALFGALTLFDSLLTMNYVGFGGNIFFDIEKIIILLLIVAAILIGISIAIRNIKMTNKNVPIPIIQEQSTSTLQVGITLSMLVFLVDMNAVYALKRVNVFIPEINLILLLLLGVVFFVIAMVVEKNRINKLKINNSKIVTTITISFMAVTTFAMYGYVKFTAAYIGYDFLAIIMGILSPFLFVILGKNVMLRRERKRFLRENNLNLLDVRNEMLGINQNEENISY